MSSYPFLNNSYRAQCINVVDGDTFDMFVDMGFHNYSLWRIRLLGVNTFELNSKIESERLLAQKARDMAITLLDKHPVIDLKYWPVRLVAHKDPDNFGRWLASLFYTDDKNVEHSLAIELVGAGLTKTS